MTRLNQLGSRTTSTASLPVAAVGLSSNHWALAVTRKTGGRELEVAVS